MASAPRASWNATSASRSSVVSTSPLQTTMRSSIPRAAKRIAPAVPSGWSSTAYRSFRSPKRPSGKCVLERVGEIPEREHDLVDAVVREPGELALEERLVRDRQQRLRRGVGEGTSRVPSPPTRTTAFTARGSRDAGHGVDVVGAVVTGAVVVGVVGPTRASSCSGPRCWRRRSRRTSVHAAGGNGISAPLGSKSIATVSPSCMLVVGRVARLLLAVDRPA